MPMIWQPKLQALCPQRNSSCRIGTYNATFRRIKIFTSLTLLRCLYRVTLWHQVNCSWYAVRCWDALQLTANDMQTNGKPLVCRVHWELNSSATGLIQWVGGGAQFVLLFTVCTHITECYYCYSGMFYFFQKSLHKHSNI